MSKYAELIEEKNGWGFLSRSLSRARVRVVALAVYFFTFLLLYFTLLCCEMYTFLLEMYTFTIPQRYEMYITFILN